MSTFSLTLSAPLSTFSLNFPLNPQTTHSSLLLKIEEGDNAVVDVIKLILLNSRSFSITKIIVKKIERVKYPKSSSNKHGIDF